jgi:hypothetical protein
VGTTSRVPPAPIKGEHHPRASPHHFPSLSISLALHFTFALSSSHHRSSPPSHHLSAVIRALVSTPSASPQHPLHLWLPPASPRSPSACRALRLWSAPPAGTPWTRPRCLVQGPMDPVHRFFYWKIIPNSLYSTNFALNPLLFF